MFLLTLYTEPEQKAPRSRRPPSQSHFRLPPRSLLLTLFPLMTVLLAGTWLVLIYNHPSGLYVLSAWVYDELMMNLNVHRRNCVYVCLLCERVECFSNARSLLLLSLCPCEWERNVTQMFAVWTWLWDWIRHKLSVYPPVPPY